MKGATVGALVLLAFFTSCVDLCIADCELPSQPAHGRLIYQSNNPPNRVSNGYIIRVICNEGYPRSPTEGDGLMVCTGSGWSSTYECVECERPTQPAYGRLIDQSPNIIRVRCDRGFRLSPDEGDGLMTCTESGWSSTYNCVALCGQLPSIPNGEITYRLGGTVARYSCTQGTVTRLEGVRKRRCVNNSWTGEAPRCRVKPICEDRNLPQHVQKARVQGRFRENLWTFGSVLTFSCQSDRYALDIPQGSYPAAECLRDGQWNATIPTCIEVTCPSILDGIQNGRSTAENRTYSPKESIEFICDSGYRTTSPSWRVCNLKMGDNGPIGEWEGVTPRCEVTTCPRLVQIENGVTISDSQNIGANGTFRCNSGYTLIGASRLTCLNTGQWNGTVPVCDSESGTHCPALATPLNGNKHGSNYHRFEKVRFSCNRGHVLIGSEERECRQDGQWSGELAKCMGPKDFDDVNQIAALLGEQIDGLKETSLVENVISPVVSNSSRGRFIPVEHEYGVDLYFMFDASKSVGIENFEKAKKFAKALVKEIGVTNSQNSLRVGAMRFSSDAQIAFHTVDYHSTEDVIKAINEIEYTGGGTNIAEALHVVSEIMVEQDIRANSFRTAFLITDGEATEGGSPLPKAIELEEKNVKIHCLGVSEGANKRQIRDIASIPKREYLFFLKDYDSLGPLIKAVTNQTPDYNECGISKLTVPSGSETDESPAREGAWPWQILLDITPPEGPPRVCGGTLLRDDTILTAAHCITEFSEMKAFAGVTDRLKKDIGQMRVIREADITKHEDFNADTYSHDIALIHVDPPFRLTPNVRPACLPDPTKANRLLHKGAAIVTGWGHEGQVLSNAVDARYEAVRYLQQLTLPLKERRDCRTSLVGDDPEANWFDETMTCAGYNNKALGACRGDSGGPLIKYASNMNRRQWTVIGISSWGIGCAAPRELDFFTNVPHFVDWIKEKMDPPTPLTTPAA